MFPAVRHPKGFQVLVARENGPQQNPVRKRYASAWTYVRKTAPRTVLAKAELRMLRLARLSMVIAVAT
jgi:hypothetical protein